MNKQNETTTIELHVRQLRHFLLVAEHGSFLTAASKAYRSQPAITKSIQSVERLLGQVLFEPAQRSTLTPFGRSCVPLLRELVLHYDRATQAVQAMATGRTGSLSVASISSLATHWLPRLVVDFMGAHPEVELHLHDDNSQNIQRMVMAGDVDFGLCSWVEPDDRLALELLVENEFAFVCRRDHQYAKRRSLPWSALKGQPLIGTTAHRQIVDETAAAMLRAPQLRVENILTLIAMLQEGAGVTVLAELGLPPYVNDLVFVPLTAPRLTRRIFIMRLKERTPSPAAAIMINALLARAELHRTQKSALGRPAKRGVSASIEF